MSCFEHSPTADEHKSFDNQRLGQILSQSVSQEQENWSSETHEDKTLKLLDNSVDFSAMSKSPTIKSSDSISCSSTTTNRRREAYPCRSAPKVDPNFRGISFTWQAKIINGKFELKMIPLLKNYKLRKRKPRCQRPCYDTDSVSGSDLDNSPKTNSKQVHNESFESLLKVCNSCGTTKTPLWRDAEDGTPLCNACGIRYKKYRLRCSKCWYIPKKDDKTYPKCVRCNAMLRRKDRNQTLKDYF